MERIPKLESNILLSFRICLSSVAILANFLTVFVIVRTEKLRKTFSLVPINLAAADILNAVGYLMGAVGSLYDLAIEKYSFVRWVCMARGFVPLLGLNATQMCTLAMSVERLVAISKPKYYSNNKLFVQKALVAVPWLYDFLCCALAFLGVDFFDRLTDCSYVVAFSSIAWTLISGQAVLITLVIAACYGVVIWKLRKQQKKIRASREREDANLR